MNNKSKELITEARSPFLQLEDFTHRLQAEFAGADVSITRLTLDGWRAWVSLVNDVVLSLELHNGKVGYEVYLSGDHIVARKEDFDFAKMVYGVKALVSALGILKQ